MIVVQSKKQNETKSLLYGAESLDVERSGKWCTYLPLCRERNFWSYLNMNKYIFILNVLAK
jgi:hypothetical protein